MKKLITITFLSIFTFTHAQVPTYVPTNGLVGWWPFNGNANDESGNGNNGTVNGATLTSDRNGVVNSAYSFDAQSNNSISIGDIDLPANFTINGWYRLSSLMGFQNIISKYGTNGGYALIFGNSTLYAHTNQGTSSGNVCNSTYNETNNFWHMVSVILSSGEIKFYIDGVQFGSCGNMNNSNPNNSMTYFGRQSYGTSENLNGDLDDIGIWNRALTEEEILALYEGCQLAITTQPQDQSVATSIGSASFVAASSSTNATYQWQTNLGLGYQNISNAGQYSGATSASLSVSNLSMANDNQVFRCIVNDGSCADTTAEATLTIIDDAGIQNITVSSIKLYPNPAQDVLYIDGLAGKEFEYEVLSIEGKLLQKGKSQGEIDLKELKKGNYVLRIGQQQVAFVKQ